MNLEGYKPVAVDCAAKISDDYGKSQVLIIAYDEAHGHTHFTTYGITPEDKESIARLADYLGEHLTGISRDACTNYEDYRYVDQGKRAAENREMRTLIDRIVCFHESGNTYELSAWISKASAMMKAREA